MQVWSKMDFDTGKVIFLDATRKEDMLQVEYPNCFLLDMGWYQDRYIISVIHNFDWANPVQQYETTETNQLPKLLTEAVRLVERNHSLPEQIERGLVMNENLFRPQFDTLKLSDKLWLMQTLATRYNLTFKELYASSRWGQSCTTGLFEKGGREFVFVPGDTVILGWESFVQGMDKANQEELADILQKSNMRALWRNFSGRA